MAMPYLVTNEQRQKNEQRSLSGRRTHEATLLLTDIIQSDKSGLSRDKVARRINQQYDEWIVEEVRNNVAEDILLDELLERIQKRNLLSV